MQLPATEAHALAALLRLHTGQELTEAGRANRAACAAGVTALGVARASGLVVLDQAAAIVLGRLGARGLVLRQRQLRRSARGEKTVWVYRPASGLALIAGAQDAGAAQVQPEPRTRQSAEEQRGLPWPGQDAVLPNDVQHPARA